MNIRSALFLVSAPNIASCPATGRPEIALIGRSNVGKSSLINMLVRSKNLAKVSATPGKTRLINFFTIDDAWTLVDLPGYGYAKGGKSETEIFSSMVGDYLLERSDLIMTAVLIDSRLSPQPIDLGFIQWMVNNGRPFSLIFTKTDKLSKKAAQSNVEAFLAEVREITAGATPSYLLSSSHSGEGRREILGFFGKTLSGEGEASA